MSECSLDVTLQPLPTKYVSYFPSPLNLGCSFIFKRKHLFKNFLMWTIFEVFIGFCYNIPSVSCFWYFGHQACGILAPQPGIKSTKPCIRRWSLNPWTTREDPWAVLTCFGQQIWLKKWHSSSESRAERSCILPPSLETGKITCKQTQASLHDKEIQVAQQPHCPTAQQTASQFSEAESLCCWSQMLVETQPAEEPHSWVKLLTQRTVG